MQNFGEQLKQFFSEATLNAILGVIGAILILIVGFALIRWVMKLLSRSNLFKNSDPAAASFLRSFISIALKLLLVLAVASKLGVPGSSIVAMIGSAGLAVGLALQGSLSNFAGGLMILLFKPFKLDDYIEIPGKAEGFVKDISIFYTTLLTCDHTKVVVPNGTVSNSELLNRSAMPTRRVELSFGIDYGAEMEKVRAAILSVARAHSLVLPDPEPTVRVSALDDSAVQYCLRAWCLTENYWDVSADLREGVKKELDRQGISIPFPQLDVHTDAGEKEKMSQAH